MSKKLMYENEKFIQGMVELGFTTLKEIETLRDGSFAKASAFANIEGRLEDCYRVWIHAGGHSGQEKKP